MQIPSLAQLKKELSYLPEKELIEVILELSKFSRDNKAFLFFKLNEKDNPGLYVEMAQEELAIEFQNARADHYYYAKKSAQKIRRKMNKLLKLTKHKTDQIEVILFFCEHLRENGFLDHRHAVLENIYQMQIKKAVKLIAGLHPDLQFDYEGRIEELT
jgi:DNA-directed RNA polymerase specialized sigma54-like protein